MAQFSDGVLEAMGFQSNIQEIEYSATFDCLHVFEIQGISLPDSGIARIDGEILGAKYAVAIGISVNELCMALSSDSYADDEPAWQAEKKCSPPYLMVRFGPTSTHIAAPSHLMMPNGNHHTYDAFASAKAELQGFEDSALPSILTAVTVALSANDRPHIRIQKVDRAVFGTASDGNTLFDISFSMNATGFISRAMNHELLTSSLTSAKSLASAVDPKVASFFRLALAETDPLKRFLYFFLSIEVQTHQTFKKIQHKEHVAGLNFPTDRIQITSASFFADSIRSWTNLKDRFLWCAHCVWANLVQSDVAEFARLKGVRDGIAHGDITIPHGSDVLAVEKLAIQLHRRDSTQQ